MSELVIFEDDKQPVEVRLDGETVWLTQAQMGEVFATSADNISLHLRISAKRALHPPQTLPGVFTGA